MKVELHRAFRDAVAVEATSLVVRDRFGQAVAVVQEPTPGEIRVAHRGDPSFAADLRVLGVPAQAKEGG